MKSAVNQPRKTETAESHPIKHVPPGAKPMVANIGSKIAGQIKLKETKKQAKETKTEVKDEKKGVDIV